MSKNTDTGITPFDLLEDIDPGERILLKLFFREPRLSEEELREAVAELPKRNALSLEETDTLLDELQAKGWVKKIENTYTLLQQTNKKGWSLHDIDRKLFYEESITESELFYTEEEELAEDERESAAKESFLDKLAYIFVENKGMLFILIGASLVNTFVLGIVDVIAVSGFVGYTGIENLPWLWCGKLILSFFLSSIVVQVIDRLPRITMMRTLIAFLLGTYLLLALFFFLDLSTKILYPIMYLVYAQQAILFPMVFWNFATQRYNLAKAKKYFPILASGELLGRLLGYSLFTLTGLLGYVTVSESMIENPSALMVVSGFLYAIGYFLFTRTSTPTETVQIQEKSAFFENIKSSFEMIRQVPFFRYVAMLVALTRAILLILLYNFYVSLNAASEQGFQFQTLYSIYNLALLFIPLLFQWTSGENLLGKISPAIGYLVLPSTLLLCVGYTFAFPSILSGVIVLFVAKIVYRGWHMPLYQSLYALVPEERRGRVRVLIGNYAYIFGSLISAILTGLVLIIVPLLETDVVSARTLYLLTALLAAIGAVYIAFRIRSTYEDSLFSWRIARRKRDSELMTELDF
ncbi:MAG: hypothetical protein HN916_17895 [Anaerolineae bacterium]|jgi:ATP:ADP antiporter, AAA family|nr:hypothetical protein [Anaerolineae bacterium]